MDVVMFYSCSKVSTVFVFVCVWLFVHVYIETAVLSVEEWSRCNAVTVTETHRSYKR